MLQFSIGMMNKQVVFLVNKNNMRVKGESVHTQAIQRGGAIRQKISSVRSERFKGPVLEIQNSV